MNSNLRETLISENLLTGEQFDRLVRDKSNKRVSLQKALLDSGLIEEVDLLEIYARIYRLSTIDLKKEKMDPSVVQLIPDKIVQQHAVVPVKKTGDTLVVAINDPGDIIALDDIKVLTNLSIKPVFAQKDDIENWVNKIFYIEDATSEIVQKLVSDEEVEFVETSGIESFNEDLFDMKDVKYKHSIVTRLVNSIIREAIESKASDIHIEPQGKFLVVRYRIDGDLKVITRIPGMLRSAIAVRIKILTKLDIAETKKPQDGRIGILINGRKIDLRISCLPIYHGEKIVIRVLDPKEAKVSYEQIGFSKGEWDVVARAMKRSQGMILATGPTGSGKTSTLYSALNYVKSEQTNIVTIEDPIEYLIPGINQTQINPVKNLTFANGLRSILRQDPNVILVGEIRDRETADIAFRSSLTGHLVLSTLHTNSAVSSITRLRDIGVKPYLIASSLLLVISQRLVKVICPHCREQYQPDMQLISKFSKYYDSLYGRGFFRGAGCENCNHTGFSGRTPLIEILRVDEDIKQQIIDNASEYEIYQLAVKNGMKPMLETGIEKVLEGTTTLEEIEKTAYSVEEKKHGKIIENDVDQLVKFANSVPSITNCRMDDIPTGDTKAVKEQRDRRKSGRIERHFFCKFHVKNSMDCEECLKGWHMITLQNLCEEGALINFDKRLKEGEELDLTLNIPTSLKPIECTSKVLRVEPGKDNLNLYKIAVHFEDIDDEDRMAISRTTDFYRSKNKS